MSYAFLGVGDDPDVSADETDGGTDKQIMFVDGE